MITKDKLKSNNSKDLYHAVGERTLRKFDYVEKEIASRRDSFRVKHDSSILEIRDNKILYEGLLESNLKGDYLLMNAEKEIGDNKLFITLNRGICGFDIHTGERFDRRLAEVAYTYDGENVNITELKDEKDFDEEKESRDKSISERVRQLRAN